MRWRPQALQCDHRFNQIPLYRIINSDRELPPPGATEEEEDKLLQDYPWVERPINIDYGTNIEVGSGVFINFNCTMIDTCKISIGSRTLIGPNVSLYSGTHPLDPDLRDGTNGPESGKPIVIGKDCWLAGNVTVLPGVTIGDGSTVGAGSVVTKVRFQAQSIDFEHRHLLT